MYNNSRLYSPIRIGRGTSTRSHPNLTSSSVWYRATLWSSISKRTSCGSLALYQQKGAWRWPSRGCRGLRAAGYRRESPRTRVWARVRPPQSLRLDRNDRAAYASIHISSTSRKNTYQCLSSVVLFSVISSYRKTWQILKVSILTTWMKQSTPGPCLTLLWICYRRFFRRDPKMSMLYGPHARKSGRYSNLLM